MVRYLSHTEIDKTKWDACIDESTNTIIYAYSWYLDIVCTGWGALVQGDYKLVMPITGNKKYGIHYIYPPYFAQQLGVFSKEKINKETVENFLNAIPACYRFIEINLNTQNTFDLPAFRLKKNTNLDLSLHKPYDLLQKEFSADTKRNIKKATKYAIRLQKNIPPSSIIKLFRENTGKKINNLKEKNYKTLSALVGICAQKGCAETQGVFTKENKLCAGVIWLTKNNRTIFLFSATNKEAKRNGAMFFIINTFIKEHAEKNNILDFEGSNLPGLARFYKGFGSNESVYLHVKKNNLPKLIRWIKE